MAKKGSGEAKTKRTRNSTPWLARKIKFLTRTQDRLENLFSKVDGGEDEKDAAEALKTAAASVADALTEFESFPAEYRPARAGGRVKFAVGDEALLNDKAMPHYVEFIDEAKLSEPATIERIIGRRVSLALKGGQSLIVPVNYLKAV